MYNDKSKMSTEICNNGAGRGRKNYLRFLTYVLQFKERDNFIFLMNFH